MYTLKNPILTCFREGTAINTVLQNVINVWKHVRQAGGHDDPPSETHHAGEDGG